MNTISLLLVLFAAAPTGTSVLPLLKIGQGPRGAALGEAYAGLANDASAVYWNPAGLAALDEYHLALSHHLWFEGITDEVFQAAVPAARGSAGFGLVYSGEPGVEEWSEENQPGDTFGTWNLAVSGGYGLRLDRFHIGAAVQGLVEDLHAGRGFGAAVDLGGIARPLPGLGVGLVCRHVGVMSYGEGMEKLPTEVVAGVSYATGPVIGCLDVGFPFDNSPNVRLGIEYAPVPEAAFRLGYRTGPSDLASLGALSGITAGLGFALGAFGLDYAIVPYGKLGLTHRIGISAALGRKGPPPVGSLTVKVVDAETRQPLSPYLALSGIKDSTVTTSEVKLAKPPTGQLVVRSVLGGYTPRYDTFSVHGDRVQQEIVAMEKVKYGEMKGGIYDASTKQPIGGRIVYRGVVYGDQTVPADPGTYRFRNLPSGEYRVGVSGPTEDYIPQACTLAIAPGRATERDFYLVKKRMTIVLEGINFETGKADILPQFTTVLDRAGAILKQTPDIRVELAGHTDPREINTKDFPSNWELSRARAEAVRKYLIDKFGIAPERLTATGYADTQPIAPNDSDEGMAKNRRTEFRILEQ